MWCLFKLLFVCSSSKTKMSSRGISKVAFRYFFPLEMITIFITQKGRSRTPGTLPWLRPLARITFSVMACINLQFYHRLFFVGNGCSSIVEDRLPAQGCPCFWTLKSAKHSVSSMFSRSNLATNFAENKGFWNDSSPKGPRMLHQKLSVYHHTLVTASLLFHEDIFRTAGFLSFRSRFRKGCRRKNSSLLKFGIWRERRRPLTQARL